MLYRWQARASQQQVICFTVSVSILHNLQDGCPLNRPIVRRCPLTAACPVRIATAIFSWCLPNLSRLSSLFLHGLPIKLAISAAWHDFPGNYWSWYWWTFQTNPWQLTKDMSTIIITQTIYYVLQLSIRMSRQTQLIWFRRVCNNFGYETKQLTDSVFQKLPWNDSRFQNITIPNITIHIYINN
jgi:hypothetical protein